MSSAGRVSGRRSRSSSLLKRAVEIDQDTLRAGLRWHGMGLGMSYGVVPVGSLDSFGEKQAQERVSSSNLVHRDGIWGRKRRVIPVQKRPSPHLSGHISCTSTTSITLLSPPLLLHLSAQ